MSEEQSRQTRADGILAKAMAWPPMARAPLVEPLLARFDSSGRREIDTAWSDETQNRVRAHERGELETVPVAGVLRPITDAQPITVEWLRTARGRVGGSGGL